MDLKKKDTPVDRTNTGTGKGPVPYYAPDRRRPSGRGTGMQRKTAAILLIIGIAALIGVLIWGISGSRQWWNMETAAVGGSADTEVYSEEIPAGDIQSIDVALVEQDLQISSGPHDTDRIRIVQYGPKGGVDDRYLVRTDKSGSLLRVYTQSAQQGWILWSWGSVPYTRVEITVPKALAGKLKAASVSGSVGIEGITADEVSAETTSGSINARDIKSESADFETVSGGARVEELSTQRLKVSSVSGSVSVDEAAAVGTADITTISGSVRCSFTELGEFDGSSTSGSVALSIADAANLRRISADTVSGSVNVDLPPGTAVNPDFTSISGNTRMTDNRSGSITVSPEGIPVKVSTTSGDLSITAH